MKIASITSKLTLSIFNTMIEKYTQEKIANSQNKSIWNK